ncbi:pectinesterase family protein [Paenibacillus xanthanilyticus]|uniref:pectinesterase family protein n=1 Tax=Paenibacillus xanthanilyticus TaxID=1783531 RepID=UPI00363CB8C8
MPASAAAGGPVYVTAASTPAGREHGYVFRDCLLTAEAGAAPVYLGRPWRDAAKTDWAGSLYGAPLHPDRWDDWEKPHARATVRYREFGCRSLVEPLADRSADRPGYQVDGRSDEPPADVPPGKDGFGFRTDRIPAGLAAEVLFRDSAFLTMKGV